MMMKPFHKPLLGLFAGVFLMALAGTAMTAFAPSAYAQEEEEEDAANQTMSPAVGTKVQEALVAGDEEDNPAKAIQILNELLNSRSGSMSPYELGASYQLRGVFKSRLDPPDVDGSISDFQRAVDTGGLTAETTRQLKFNIARLYIADDRFAEAVTLLEEYIRDLQALGETIDGDTWYLMAGAYVSLEDYQSARRPMENALDFERQKASPNKNYFGLMNFIYSELGAADARSDLLVEMINLWPEDEIYWSQLAGAYSSSGQEDEAAAVLELAYRAGIIDDGDKILTLIRMYTFLDNPYRAALLLEKEMAAGNIERSQDNLELLAQAYNQAREQKKALVPLQAAAEMAPTGELYYRLGQIYFADEQWENSIDALTAAINRGGLESNDIGDAWLLIGNAHYNIDTNSEAKRDQAIAAWSRARNYNRSRQAASGWISYVEEVRRVERNQDRVELLQREEAFKNEQRRCRTNIEIFERIGQTADISEDEISRCRRVINAKWQNQQVVLADGTTYAGVEDVE